MRLDSNKRRARRRADRDASSTRSHLATGRPNHSNTPRPPANTVHPHTNDQAHLPPGPPSQRQRRRRRPSLCRRRPDGINRDEFFGSDRPQKRMRLRSEIPGAGAAATAARRAASTPGRPRRTEANRPIASRRSPRPRPPARRKAPSCRSPAATKLAAKKKERR